MARGKKSGPSRMDLRREAEAVEAREEEVEEEAEEEESSDDDSSDDEDGEAKPKKAKAKPKAKAAPKPKKPAAPRKPRAVKEVRMKAVWVVFDNSSKRIDTFPFNQKSAAEELLAKKNEEKKGHFYLQMVKEQLE